MALHWFGTHKVRLFKIKQHSLHVTWQQKLPGSEEVKDDGFLTNTSNSNLQNSCRTLT